MDASGIKTIGVIGSGQMGCGIAQVAAQAGMNVVLLDAQKDLAEKGKARIAGILGKLVEKGKLDAASRDQTIARLTPAGDYAALAPCEFVVEAAPESERIKLEIFTAAEKATRPETILASNTSSI